MRGNTVATPLRRLCAAPSSRGLPKHFRRRSLCTACLEKSRVTPWWMGDRRTVKYSSYNNPRLHTHRAEVSRRRLATVAAATIENGREPDVCLPLLISLDAYYFTENHDDIGPLQEYDSRVDSGMLRNDEHQRGRSCSLPAGPAGNMDSHGQLQVLYRVCNIFTTSCYIMMPHR
jgi:hypothetical protein